MSDEERFSYVVERYFRKRGTCPVGLFYRNSQVDDAFLVELTEEVQARFGDRDDIEIVTTTMVEGDYWSGVLVEFDQPEFEGVDTDNLPFGENKSLHSKLSSLYREYDECDTYVTGYNKGVSRVYACSALEGLGREYFKTMDDVYSGPTIT